MKSCLAFVSVLVVCGWLRGAEGAPVITRQPVSQLGVHMGTATFTVTASGAEPLRYQWFRNDQTFAQFNQRTIKLEALTENDVGVYTVTVSNAVGAVTSEPVVLSLGAPVIVSQPEDKHVPVGVDISLYVEAMAKPAPTYQWHKNGQALAGRTHASLNLYRVKPGDSGAYTVTVTNSAGSTTSRAAILAVGETKPAPVAQAAPAAKPPVAAPATPARAAPLPAPPAQVSVNIGRPVTLKASADGKPPFKFQWQKDGKPLAGATQETLTIRHARPADAGLYVCIVTNAAGSTPSDPVKVTVAASP